PQRVPVGDPGGEELRVGLQRQVRSESVGRAERGAEAARVLGGEEVQPPLRYGCLRIERHDLLWRTGHGPGGVTAGRIVRGDADLPDGARALVVGEIELPIELRQGPEDQRWPQLHQALEARERTLVRPA